MASGALKKVNKSINVVHSNAPEIELSMNSFINRNNYLGLISSEPDPKKFFNMEKT